ncbi:MAG: 23S rRNA (guanosine(2251)-2'-O)-methyltransferase RlmB [Planctomycetaceae bacterium]|jgi:23S rRNA (guanosine2251-2'-O)-methyltransferase|nr:23S rRNA (guanosine(2251)-2'-O)-methyltransferase RlmB [Planctomycetaceae bacterium]
MSASRRSRKSNLMGNHQRSWIWGRHAVLEAIRSERWFPLEIRTMYDLEEPILQELRDWHSRQSELGDPTSEPILGFDSSSRLQELCHQPDHQGLIARMPPYPYLPADEVIKNLSGTSFLLILDGIQDAFNFGACLRCAEVFGVDAVLVGTKGQSGVNSQVVRSSAGAVHHVPISQTENLPEILSRMRSVGVTIVAATEKADDELPSLQMHGALAIMIGNEGNGIAPTHLELSTHRVKIPQVGHVQSLNAAVATGIVLYEAVRQRQSDHKQSGTEA